MDRESEAEYAAFFAASWAPLFRTTYAMTGDVSAAEDALQSAFARAFASWPRVRAAEHPIAYVRRMAVNEVLGVRRRAFWKAERPSGDQPPPDLVGPHDDQVVDRDAVWQALLSLPVRQRAVIVLRYYEDLSEQQIAETLGCSRGTVKSQASAALRSLRAHAEFAPHGLSPAGEGP